MSNAPAAVIEKPDRIAALRAVLPADLSHSPLLGILAVIMGAGLSSLAARLLSLGLADLRGHLGIGVDEGAWIPTAFNASRKNTAFFCDDSIKVASRSARATRQGMIGRPAPEPTSAIFAFCGRCLSNSSDSSTCRVANSSGAHGATRCRRSFQRVSKLKYSPSCDKVS